MFFEIFSSLLMSSSGMLNLKKFQKLALHSDLNGCTKSFWNFFKWSIPEEGLMKEENVSKNIDFSFCGKQRNSTKLHFFPDFIATVNNNDRTSSLAISDRQPILAVGFKVQIKWMIRRHPPKLNFKKFNSSVHGEIKGVQEGRQGRRLKVTLYLTYLSHFHKPRSICNRECSIINVA